MFLVYYTGLHTLYNIPLCIAFLHILWSVIEKLITGVLCTLHKLYNIPSPHIPHIFPLFRYHSPLFPTIIVYYTIFSPLYPRSPAVHVLYLFPYFLSPNNPHCKRLQFTYTILKSTIILYKNLPLFAIPSLSPLCNLYNIPHSIPLCFLCMFNKNAKRINLPLAIGCNLVYNIPRSQPPRAHGIGATWQQHTTQHDKKRRSKKWVLQPVKMNP